MPSRPQIGESPPPPLPLPLPPLPLRLPEATSFDRGKERRDHRVLVAGAAAGGGITAAIAFFVVLLLLYRRWFRGAARNKKTNSFGVPDSVDLRRFSYRDLKAATRSFSDAQKLGQGGFGAVYKGLLPNSGQEIAVKILDATSLQGEREFQNEVSVIGRIRSPHIVGLLGFCADSKRGRRLLVYEYMQNRSLQDALFDEGYAVQLGWGERFRIILDTAKALAFLHSKCEPAIIHGDIKPSNILLDGNFNVRIADFGLARFNESKLDVTSAGGEGAEAEAELRVEREQRYRRRERRNEKKIREESMINIAERENNEAAKYNADGDLKVNEDGDLKAIAGGDLKPNIDGDQRSVGTMQSPETFVSNSPTEENVIFMSSNAASPEGLHYDTDTVTDTQEERTPSEIVDLAKNNNNLGARDRTVDCKSVDFSRDDDDRMSLSECFEKASLDSGRPGSAHNHHPGRRKKGKDWWRRGDSSGELSVKEYVMEWIGSEIKKEQPKGSWRADEESERDSNTGSSRTGKKKHRRKESVEWWAALAEENKENNKKEKLKCKGREWWREEYCDELSNKGRKLKSKSRSGEWWNSSEEEMKKWWRRSKSVSRDWWWSGEDHQPPQQNHFFNGGDCASGISSTPSTRGTVCYVAPECGGVGVVSEKSDVYSFGVVMLVVISGRRPLQVMASPITELERANLISWVRHLARAGKVLELVDGAVEGDYDKDQALLCITVALLCLQRRPAARPSMCHVVKFLSGEMEAPPLPVEFSPSPPYGVPFRSRRKSSSSSRPHSHNNGHR